MTRNEESRELYEKEKPKKPIMEQHFYGTEFYCPKCNSNLNYKFPIRGIKYCCECGQKIDWSYLDEGG